MVDWTIKKGWLDGVKQEASPHFEKKSCQSTVELLVIHNISLPPGKFGGDYITDLFLGRLDPKADEFFEQIYKLRVSAHCLIRRDGEIIQYVSFDNKAWHAGISQYQGKEKCNDFSIGIELEGTDFTPYTEEQYQQLAKLTDTIRHHYPEIKDSIVGHCDIAPDRKTDPGPSFDWQYFKTLLK